MNQQEKSLDKNPVWMTPPKETLQMITPGAIIRPAENSKNQITFLWEKGGRIADLVYTPSGKLAFVLKEGGKIHVSEKLEEWEPLSWLQNFARRGALSLPSEAAQYHSLTALAEQMRHFIHHYFDCDEDFERVATLFALHTWIYDLFSNVPYLRFIGMSGCGKTRATRTVGALCYRFQMIAGNVTPPTIFRLMDAVGGTVAIDEADFIKTGIGSDILKVLNSGYEKGSPVIRQQNTANGDWEPRAYEVFGPKIINGRSRFKDDATENRCLDHQPRPTQREDIPTQLPPEFESEALRIRNMALRWRLDVLESFNVSEVRIPDIRPRTNQLILPLNLIALQLKDGTYCDALMRYVDAYEKRASEEQRATVECMLVEAYIRLSKVKLPTCGDLAKEVIQAVGSEDPRLRDWLTGKSVSRILKEHGFTTTHSNRGSLAKIEPRRLDALCQRFRIVTTSSQRSSLTEPSGGDASDGEVMIN